MMTLTDLRLKLDSAYRMDEEVALEQLLRAATLPDTQVNAIKLQASDWVAKVRAKRLNLGGVEALMQEYDLSSEEGIALMCMAEAMLRIPDKATVDKLIADKLAMANWAEHAGQSDSFFVNATTWALNFSGRVLKNSHEPLKSGLKSLFRKSTLPIIRAALTRAMKMLGDQFVLGETIRGALKKAADLTDQGYRFSFDMLGEAARTAADAKRYFQAYLDAIEAIALANTHLDVTYSSGISIKLSALFPRYEYAQHDRAVAAAVPQLLALVLKAKEHNIPLTVDAEEADRLMLSLDIIEQVFIDPQLAGWEGFGLAVQSYQKRGFYVLDWLQALAERQQKRLFVRLIKGAYWDTEIKVSQVGGFESYPVFTRKIATDVSFIACAKKMLAAPQAFYCQFATHNAYTAAAVLTMAGERTDFEFQCLHGMGYTLYDEILASLDKRIACRVYAPVGGHEDLLAYLVRRLLENGANSSFVNQITDVTIPLESIIVDPVSQLRTLAPLANPRIPAPRELYGLKRVNSMGLDLSHASEYQALQLGYKAASEQHWFAKPTLSHVDDLEAPKPVRNPAHVNEIIGEVYLAKLSYVEKAFTRASEAFDAWSQQAIGVRAACLRRAADLLEQQRFSLMYLATHEAGKTLSDANAEVREAIDFCRYYAAQAELTLQPEIMSGPTGESNVLSLVGRGTIICISPWNFPLAIFMGQVTAALVTGNCVLAKPAGQTPLIAARAVQLLHAAGIPENVLQLVPGSGATVGEALISDKRLAGVIFTGSTATAHHIHQTLATREGPIVPWIAETGGQNMMIIDSSALIEQAVADVLISAFGSAGQRCSALRVLWVQHDIADKVITMLQGAMAELSLGDPGFLTTDVGPVIDSAAQQGLNAHKALMQRQATLIYECASPTDLPSGSFVLPAAYELSDLSVLTEEVFGPILHVLRFDAANLPALIQQINGTGYGLTLGIHSRIDSTIDVITRHAKVGNIYVNRSMTGAVVGVQPFGGEGLSGTGPKAGGPHYLHRLVNERTLTVNITAAGGNASLLML